MNDYEDILGAGGPLARSLPGFAPRLEQIQMARRVGAALESLEPLIVEAGTGTGKTFAYLVPALLSGRHVIISTGTRTLQDQLFHRDLPEVAGALGRPVKIALLKGRANYLCRHRLKLAGSTPELQMELITPARRKGSGNALHRIRQWAERTKTGDVSEVTGFSENHPAWAAVTSTRENCLGADCPEYSRCHVVAARRAAQSADIVIVNHYLLLADLALKEEGFGDLLPGTEAVILDEAHQIPEIAAQFFGLSLSGRQLSGFVRDTFAELKRAAIGSEAVSQELEALEVLIAEFRSALPRSHSRIEWRAVGSAAIEILGDIETRLTRIGKLLVELQGDTGVEQSARLAAELAARCGELRLANEETGVRWIELHPQSWTLQYTPFEVAGKIQQFMSATPCSWIFTSATLAVGDDFAHFTQRIGQSGARTVRIDSPFDYQRQALIYLPEKMSDPSAPGHSRDVIEATLPLLEAAGGRAFILFTSHRALTEGSAWLKQKWGESPPFPVLVQGEAPRDALLREFRSLGNAVLLGTGSFWEGVDVKGDALSIVIIDKLPFASPDDPVLSARLEGIRRRGGNPFYEYQVPQAVLALKQGVGRLIRDEGDFGVIVLCDPRLRTRSYGKVFLKSLPPMPVTTNLREAVEFLETRLYGVKQKRAAL